MRSGGSSRAEALPANSWAAALTCQLAAWCAAGSARGRPGLARGTSAAGSP